MRIAFLNSWYSDRERGSGTAAAIAGLMRGLESLGHQVETVAPKFSAPGRTLRRLYYNMEQRIRALPGDFDLVVGFDIDGFWLRREGRWRYGVCLFGISAEEMLFERGWPRAYLGALSRLERLNARRADKVIVPSAHSRRIAMAAYGLKPEVMAVVPLGIDPSVWEARGDPSPRRDKASPVILSVARQYPRKNTKSLLAAMPAVRAAVSGVRLRIVGGGPMLPSLKAQAAKLGLGGTVEFLGEVPGDDSVRQEFFRADVFCLPSLQEGFGLVFLEAMAAGVPIVAAEAGAVPEVAPDGEVGRLVPGENVRALEGAIIDLLRNDAERARLGAAGRARARRFGWEESARRFVRIFE